MADKRLIEVTLLSASNLKDVNYLSKMETYAVLSFPPYVDYTTQVDRHGNLNPTWNEKLGFMIPEAVLQRAEGHLKVEIFTTSTLGPKFVSEASIPLIDISFLPRLNEPFVKKYPLKSSSGDFHGEVTISFTVGDKVRLKVGEQDPSNYPIVTGFGTGRPTHDLPSQGTLPPTPSRPLLTLPTPYGSQYDQSILSPQPTIPPKAYGQRPVTPPGKEYDYIPLPQQPTSTHAALPQPARVPAAALGKPYHGYMPLHQQTTTQPGTYSGEGKHHFPEYARPQAPAPSLAFPSQPPKWPAAAAGGGAKQEVVEVPVTLTHGGGGGYGSADSYYDGTAQPFQSGANLLFTGPLGKLLLTDLTTRPFNRRAF